MQNSPIFSIALPLVLAFIMFGLGLHLQRADFARIAQRPLPVVVALVCQMLLLPAIAFGLVHWLALPGALGVGLMLLSATPGGMTANLYSHLFKGDVALNITLTAINSLLVVVSIPLIVDFSLRTFMGAEPYVPLQWNKTAEVLLLVLIPVGVGMWVSERYPAVSARLDRPVKLLSLLVLVLLTAVVLLREWASLGGFFVQVGLACVLFNVLSLLVGYLAGRLIRAGEASSRAMAFEIGVHNTTLAFYLALSVLNDPRMSIAPAVYSLSMYVLAFAMGFALQRWRPLGPGAASAAY